MKYIVGIDGGGTRTKCVFADASGHPVLEISGGASNFLTIGTDKAVSSITSVLMEALQKLNCSFDDVLIIAGGISGAGRKSHSENLRSSLIKKLPENFKNIYIDSDARIALEGALAGEPGAILIAGTGSVVFGKDNSKKIFRAGGYGRIIGDEGSGYSIGAKTLKKISQMIDGRKDEGKMLKSFGTIFNINNSDDLIRLVYNPGFDIPSIALFTVRAAEENIPEAGRILDEESDELIKHITAIKNKLNLVPLRLVLIGSLIENDNYYSRLLIDKINSLNDIEINEKRYPPEMGAVIMAKKILTENQAFQ